MLTSTPACQLVHGQGVATLRIAAFDAKSDAGEYKCTATNELGTAATSTAMFEQSENGFHLQNPTFPTESAEVKAEPQPPSFKKLLEHTEVKSGNKLKLQCEIGGDAPLEVVWKLNGQSLEESKDHKVSV